VKAVMPAAKAYYSLLEKKDLYYSMGETKGIMLNDFKTEHALHHVLFDRGINLVIKC
jgi:hypothetical protein